ncbi:MAG: uroporphyrinogen-III C-methyltransferase [Clostridiales bacterium]|nr:uroporphyrinogen-III C-methyltransferase [Clostridiales bacterium]
MGEAGKVYILGVGPGDYKLLTLKAAECIEKADVIVYDRLVNTKILRLAKQDAEFIYVGKMPDHHAVPQDGINEILAQKALEGKTVARVKGGDPFMFGRGGEEAETLVEKGIEFEIIPGVTSAISVPAYAGIPVTHRDYSSSLHIITGHEKPGKETSFIDYEVLSKLEGTLVFLMGVKNLSEISSNLIKYGKDRTTPVAVIEKGTTSSQRTVTGTLENIASVVTEEGVKSPAVTIIGGVVNLKAKLNWFPKGELAGKRVLVTRSREQASRLVQIIEELGGESIEFPTIKIAQPLHSSQFDEALNIIKIYNWLVFTSVNGVASFFDRMKFKKIDIRNLIGVKICAVGEATAAELENHCLITDYMPGNYSTADLLKGLLQLVKPDEKVLLARADIGSEELSKGLKENNVDFDDLAVYRTLVEASRQDEVIKLLDEKNLDFITFTSSSTVRNFVSILGRENLNKLSDIKIVCIGPVTKQTAKELGLNVTAVADVYTIDGLVNKLLEITKG